MIKLGRMVRHPKHGVGEILGITRWPGREYVARFRQPDGCWVTAYMSRGEVWHRPKQIRKRLPYRKRKPVENVDHQPATREESRAMESLGLTLQQVREARAGS